MEVFSLNRLSLTPIDNNMSAKKFVKFSTILLILFVLIFIVAVSDSHRNPYNDNLPVKPPLIEVEILDFDWNTRQALFSLIFDHPAKLGFFTTYYDILVTFEIRNLTDEDILVKECYIVDNNGWYYHPVRNIDYPQMFGKIDIPSQGKKIVSRSYQNIDVEALPLYIICDRIKSTNLILDPP